MDRSPKEVDGTRCPSTLRADPPLSPTKPTHISFIRKDLGRPKLKLALSKLPSAKMTNSIVSGAMRNYTCGSPKTSSTNGKTWPTKKCDTFPHQTTPFGWSIMIRACLTNSTNWHNSGTRQVTKKPSWSRQVCSAKRRSGAVWHILTRTVIRDFMGGTLSPKNGTPLSTMLPFPARRDKDSEYSRVRERSCSKQKIVKSKNAWVSYPQRRSALQTAVTLVRWEKTMKECKLSWEHFGGSTN